MCGHTGSTHSMLQDISLCFTNLTQSNDVRSHWQYEYGYGASNELYTGAMSSDFVGMSFPQVAE